jgi:hypothetical protein
VPPAAPISSAKACAPSASKSVTATFAPSEAKTRAVARPMPLAAPVTRTGSPFTDRLSCLNSGIARLAIWLALTRLAPISTHVKQA